MLALPHSGKRCKVPGQGKFRSAFRLQKSKACRFTRQLQVISGYVKYDQRAILKQILERKLPGMPEERKRTVHVFVGSVRALARNAMVGEEIYKQSKKNNINILPQDYATLFSHSETPTGNFIRKLICSLQELDRDTLVWRLQQGQSSDIEETVWQAQSQWNQELPRGSATVQGCATEDCPWGRKEIGVTLDGDRWQMR